MAEHDLDRILAALNQHHQRATYSAVAALLGRTPRHLMHCKPRLPDNSWVVSKATGRPSGYADEMIHPQLMDNATVIRTREELAAWLARQ